MNLKTSLSIFGGNTYHYSMDKYDRFMVKFLKRKDGVDFLKNVFP